MKYLLDTNTFWKVLEEWNSYNQTSFDAYIKQGNKYIFCLSEISAMEIYSVIGKYIRGKQKQECLCERTVRNGISTEKCIHTWISPEQKKLNTRLSKAYKRLVEDLLNNRNTNFEIEILSLDGAICSSGRFLLEKYAFTQDFHSLDATIAATAIEKNKAEPLTVITFDKKLRNILALEGLLLN